MTSRVLEEMHNAFPTRQTLREDFVSLLMKLPTKPNGRVYFHTWEEYTEQGWGAILQKRSGGIGLPTTGTSGTNGLSSRSCGSSFGSPTAISRTQQMQRFMHTMKDLLQRVGYTGQYLHQHQQTAARSPLRRAQNWCHALNRGINDSYVTLQSNHSLVPRWRINPLQANLNIIWKSSVPKFIQNGGVKNRQT